VRKPLPRFYVYIVASKRRTLYVGVTSDLKQRVHQHQNGLISGFSSKFEEFAYVRDAIARERQLKGWRREKKIALIEKENPDWKDLCEDWAWW